MVAQAEPAAVEAMAVMAATASLRTILAAWVAMVAMAEAQESLWDAIIQAETPLQEQMVAQEVPVAQAARVDKSA